MAFAVTVGDRIAQLVLERIMTPPVLEVDVSVSLSRSVFSADVVPEPGRHPSRHQWVWVDWWSRWSLDRLVFLFVSIPIYEPKSARAWNSAFLP